MSALDNGRSNLEFLWGFGLDKVCRTAIKDGITICVIFQVGWKDDGLVEEDFQLVHYFGWFDGDGSFWYVFWLFIMT